MKNGIQSISYFNKENMFEPKEGKSSIFLYIYGEIRDFKVEMGLNINVPPLSSALSSLLEIIPCLCKTNCTSRCCTCINHVLICSCACGEFGGTSCSNFPNPDLVLMKKIQNLHSFHDMYSVAIALMLKHC